MILWDTILDKLEVKGVDARLVDVRYTANLREAHPDCFPKYNYTIIFNSQKIRYEFWKC
jgi:hypothetical protein